MKQTKHPSTASDLLGCLGLLLAWCALAWLILDIVARLATLPLWSNRG